MPVQDFLSVLYSEPVDPEFVREWVKKARAAHELPNETREWNVIEHRLGELIAKAHSWLLIALIHYMFLCEYRLQERFAETLDDARRAFYDTQWLPYLRAQTTRMKEAMHEDPEEALRLYSDSLREAWQWQRIEHSDPLAREEPNVVEDLKIEEEA